MDPGILVALSLMFYVSYLRINVKEKICSPTNSFHLSNSFNVHIFDASLRFAPAARGEKLHADTMLLELHLAYLQCLPCICMCVQK